MTNAVSEGQPPSAAQRLTHLSKRTVTVSQKYRLGFSLRTENKTFGIHRKNARHDGVVGLKIEVSKGSQPTHPNAVVLLRKTALARIFTESASCVGRPSERRIAQVKGWRVGFDFSGICGLYANLGHRHADFGHSTCRSIHGCVPPPVHCLRTACQMHSKSRGRSPTFAQPSGKIWPKTATHGSIDGGAIVTHWPSAAVNPWSAGRRRSLGWRAG